MGELLAQKTESAPDSPGVYFMKGAAGEALYVGKAKRLRSRLRAYLTGTDTRAFVALLDDLLGDIELVLTHTEKEALILENELIKEHQPRFNVKLTDDKRFLSLRLDTRKPYPRLELVRRIGRDGARHFGPYHSATAIRETLRIVNRYFQLRTCSDQVMRRRRRPCLQYQIHRCPAPCVYEIPEAYAENVDHVEAFLGGDSDRLLATLEAKMQRHAALLEFERAAQLRDQLRAVRRSIERQRVATTDFVNRDVVGLYREGPAVEIHVMRTREGRLMDARRFSFDALEQPAGEVLADFAVRYYAEEAPPREILFPTEMSWGSALSEFLGEGAGHKISVLTPQRGDKRRLLQLAVQNAQQAFADKQRQQGAARTAIERLQRALRLRRRPEQIECVDISHLGGEQIVGSVVRFAGGVPDKGLYRHYKIRSTADQDDFQSIYEVISRRARRGIEEGDLPDLLVIDGGKGQLGAARAGLDDHGIDGVDLIGLAKARPDGGKESTRALERVFVFGQKDPIVLRQNSAELFLLVRTRDEAHRFAIGFQRQLRKKAVRRSALDEIPGVGPKRRRALLTKLGSVARIKKASQEEIAAIVGEKIARAVVAHLHPEGTED